MSAKYSTIFVAKIGRRGSKGRVPQIMGNLVLKNDPENQGEVVIYQPDEVTRLEVQINNETVWLTQGQIAQLFGVGQPAISKHLKNIFASGECDIKSVYSILEYTASDGKLYKTGFYNLDAILSVGYRVNSKNATHFRRWANRILEEHSKKIDFFIRTSLPPVEGIFFDGQIYDAYAFVSGLVRCAEKYIILIDNYIDDTVLTILDKRKDNVDATIYTSRITKDTSLDIRKHNMQYRPIQVREFRKAHDRFLIIDDKVYLIGASIKDLGKKWFGFTLMENISAEDIIKHLQSTQ